MPRFIFIPSAATTPSIYDGATGAYSLRKYFGWSSAVIRVRRSSDNSLAYVFFDGTTSQDTISLSSYISTSSDTTPDATTLSTWLSSDNCFVYSWYFQQPSNTIDSDLVVSQTTNSKQPTFATSGVIETKNTKICISFNSSNSQHLIRSGRSISALDSANNFSFIHVTNNNNPSANPSMFNTLSSTSYGFALYVDTNTSKRMLIQSSSASGNLITEYIARETTANQRLINIIHNSTNNVGYYNNVLQDTVAHSGSSFGNSDILVGATKTSYGFLNGAIQEIIIFPSDKTSELSTINSEINGYYSIY